jgi:hypothetical protein
VVECLPSKREALSSKYTYILYICIRTSFLEWFLAGNYHSMNVNISSSQNIGSFFLFMSFFLITFTYLRNLIMDV